MTFTRYREESRKNYGQEGDVNLTLEQLRTGALLRIADSVEKLCEDRDRLERQCDQYRKSMNYWLARAQKLERSNVALKGHLTRLRDKLAAL